MGAIYILLGALGGLTIALLRWTSDEYEREGRLSEGAVMAGYALVVLHALVTLVAAISGVWLVDDVPAPVAVAVGLLLVAAGMALVVWSARALGGWRRVTGQVVDRLVESGPYARLRHPQYVGWALVLLGVAVCGRSGLALALAAAFAVGAVFFARVEDQHLARQFGR